MNDKKICYYCGNEYEEEKGVKWGRHNYCDKCFKELHCSIDEYHSPKLETEFLSLRNERTKEYIGIELEINTNDYNVNHKDTIFYIRKNYKHLKLNFEHDGSIGNGFEIITQPMTIEYIKEHKEEFKDILKYLSKSGYQSHNSSNCGLHIHISKDYLGENTEEIDNTIDKITLFVETFKDSVCKISRREGGRYREYITSIYNNFINDLPSTDYLKSTKILKEIKDKNGSLANGSRYFVVNTTNEHTIELRMFKGTLKFETFMATIEFAHNLINVCKENMVSKISWNKVINYSGEYLKEYNENLGIIGNEYLRDYTKDIEDKAREFLERDNKEIDNYNDKLQELINMIDKVLNKEIDLTRPCTETIAIMKYKSQVINSIGVNLIVDKKENRTLYEILKYYKNRVNYDEKFKKLQDILVSYTIPDTYKEEIYEIINYIDNNIIVNNESESEI